MCTLSRCWRSSPANPRTPGAPFPCGQPAEAGWSRTNGPVVTATSGYRYHHPGRDESMRKEINMETSYFVTIGGFAPGLPGGSDGKGIEFVPVILASGDSRPVPSVDGLVLMGEVGDPWPGDEEEEPQPTDSRNNAPTNELEQTNRNSLTATPLIYVQKNSTTAWRMIKVSISPRSETPSWGDRRRSCLTGCDLD